MEDDRVLLPIMNALLAFECVGRVASFSEAARLMGTSQPSASRYVANLEDYLGCRLFQRNNNRIALTEEGERLHRAVSVSFDNLRQTVEGLRASKPARALTIGCTHGFAHLWIMPRFSALQSLSPHREIRVVTLDPRSTSGAQDVDLLIGFDAGRSDDGGGVTLFDEAVILVASPAFAAEFKSLLRPGNPDLLTQVPLVHLDDGEEAWVSWRAWFAHHGQDYAPPPRTYFYRNYAFTLQAAAEGRGVTLAWKGLLGPYLDNGWLEVLDFPEMRTGASYRLDSREALSASSQGQALIAWFQEEAQACSAL